MTDDRRATLPTDTGTFSLSFAILLVVWVAGVVIQTFWTPVTPAGEAAAIFLGPLFALTLSLIVLGRRFLPLLASYRFSVALLTGLTAATAAGTLVLQGATVHELRGVYGPVLAAVVRWLFLDDVFHAFWFNGLLVLVVVVLLVVVIRKRPVALAQIGFYSAHTGIVVILLGALLGALFGVEGIVQLREGQSTATLVLTERGRTKRARVGGQVRLETRDLGFAVRLDAFEVDHYENPLKLLAYPSRDPEARPVGSYTVETGAPAFRVPGTHVRARVVGVEEEAGRAILEVETGAGTGRMAVTRTRPTLLPGEDTALILFQRQVPEAREFRSRVAILENGRKVQEGTIRVNQPLAHRGYQFYQYKYDPDRPGYSSLQVRRDPGLPLVFLGFVIVGFGALHFLFRTGAFRRRRVIER